jgi:hypothetical protein
MFDKKNRENNRNMTGCHLATGIFKKKYFIVKILLKCTKMLEMKPF